MRAGIFTKAKSGGLIGFKPAVLPVVLLLLSGCMEAGTSTSTAATKPGVFQARYEKARAALEAGKFDRAISGYKALLPQAGPLAPRLQLELAHAQLRNGDYAASAQAASALAISQQGDARAAALAVQGVAQHEMALTAIQAGRLGEAAGLLTQADKAMAEVLKTNVEMDPLGALAARRAAIKVQKDRISS